MNYSRSSWWVELTYGATVAGVVIGVLLVVVVGPLTFSWKVSWGGLALVLVSGWFSPILDRNWRG